MTDTRTTIIARETRAERIERALDRMTAHIPGTKGLGPKDRAERLHAEMERRIADAKHALRYGHWNEQNEWVSEP